MTCNVWTPFVRDWQFLSFGQVTDFGSVSLAYRFNMTATFDRLGLRGVYRRVGTSKVPKREPLAGIRLDEWQVIIQTPSCTDHIWASI